MALSKPTRSDKPYLRDYFLERRRELVADADRKAALDAEIQTRLLMSAAYRDADTVLLYMARPHEISTSLIIHAALANHKTVGLPVCLDDGIMEFRRIDSLSDLRPGRYGILEPPENEEVIIPDAHTLCVCPSLCCDMRGFRLGFGGGYYDRYLADFPGIAAALCYADSLIPEIEHGDFDIHTDLVVTDSYIKYIK